ncbi:MAG TPA: DedA family protein/thiosulfate sulfurtransferase GlpE [Burkholderiaceae bacterium]
MPPLIELLAEYGLFLVFANVLLEQMGLPIPAYPTMLIAGALAATGALALPAVLFIAVLACLIADLGWYGAGLRHGKRILGFLCKVSLSPDTCVNQTEERFRRWGPKSLLVSKFVPGFNTIASPLAGALATPRRQFLTYSIMGSMLWSGSAVLLGVVFHRSLDTALEVLSDMGGAALLVLGGLLALFIVYKYAERQRLYRSLRMARITVPELRALMDRGMDPVVIDARSATAQQLQQPIPGALLFRDPLHAARLAEVPRDREIVVYCNCPNEASAAVIARQLRAQGFRQVRPLVGGLDSWDA